MEWYKLNVRDTGSVLNVETYNLIVNLSFVFLKPNFRFKRWKLTKKLRNKFLDRYYNWNCNLCICTLSCPSEPFVWIIQSKYISLILPIIIAIEFFTISPQCKNVNIANYVLAVPLKINYSYNMYNLEMPSSCSPWFLISYLLISIDSNNEENCKHMGIQSWQ